MAYEHKEGYGAIFKNTKPGQHESAPAYRGNLMVGGVLYAIAGWVKTGAKGPFLSLKAQVDDGSRGEPRNEPKRDSAGLTETEIPF